MLKKNMFQKATAFLLAVMLMFTAIPGFGLELVSANPIEETLTAHELVETLNNLNLGDSVEFFLLDQSQSLGRSTHDSTLRFDTLAEAQAFLVELFDAIRTPHVFELDLTDAPATRTLRHNYTTAWSPLFSSLGLSWFNISFSYNLNPNRPWPTSTPGITNMTITNSWFTGIQVLTSWTHNFGDARTISFGANYQTISISATGVLLQGISIGGADIGFSSTETARATLNASW